MKKKELNNNWTTIIKPSSGLFNLHLKELWNYRDLIKLLVHRDLVTIYKQTVLGPIWFIIQPLFTAGIFTLIFGKIANISTEQIPPIVFYLSGVVNWNYFSRSLELTSTTFVDNAGIFGKVFFPRLAVPVSIIITNFVKYLIQFALFLAVMLLFMFKGAPIRPNSLIVFLPLVILQMITLSFGLGILLSSFTTKYRDLKFFISFLIQLWMYASPVIYPLSLIPARYKMFFIINPMVSILEFFRRAMLGTGTINILYIQISIAMTLLILVSGLVLFNKTSRNFMDTV